MLIAILTIRIDDTNILNHAVKVQHSRRGAAEDGRDAIGKSELRDSLILQSLPATTVQYSDIRHTEANSPCLQRHHQVLPNHVRESVDENLGRAPFCGE